MTDEQRAKERYAAAVNDLHDHTEELKELRQKIKHLEAVNQSLRTEIRTQRHEIAQLINVRNVLLDMDKPPVKDTL